ncbi:ABC transporter permease [Planococcus sp. ISL-109]|uniref:ABC transporter permease n=1 Tax=Planococcus sp. ISL-109 TaxID=2819166 RepID=UPI002035AE68|nr:ABC transporter permease [Planococcus sp. ISL-109]
MIFFIGIMFSTSLIFFALMLNGTIERMTTGYLEEVDYEYEAYLDPTQPPPALQGGDEKFLSYPFAAFNNEVVALQVLGPDSRLYKLFDGTRTDITDSLDTGVIISVRLQIKEEIEIGDTLHVEINNEEVEFLVQGVVDEYISDRIYMDQETLSRLLTENRSPDLYNGIYALEMPSSESYQSVLSKRGIIQQSESLQSYSRLMFNVMIAGSLIIASSIMFVLTSFTVEKNYYTISLLKVMGYSRREVNAMILNSYFAYALVSFLLSIPIALFVIRRMLFIFAQDYGIVLPLEFEPVFGLIALLLLIFIYFLSTYLSRRKIERISLQEVLKTYGQ